MVGRRQIHRAALRNAAKRDGRSPSRIAGAQPFRDRKSRKPYLSQFWEQWRHEVFIGLVFSGVVGLALVWMQVQIDDRRAGVDRVIEDRREDRAEMLADVAYIRETLRDDGPRNFYNLNLRGANLSGLDFGCALPGVADDSGQLLTPFDIEFGMTASAEVGFYSPVEYGEVDRLLELRERHMNPEWPPEERVESPDSDCTRFSGSDFTGANLDETNFTGSTLDDVVFAPEPIDESWFAGARITGEIDAELRRSDLRSVSFYADEGRPSAARLKSSDGWLS